MAEQKRRKIETGKKAHVLHDICRVLPYNTKYWSLARIHNEKMEIWHV